MPLDSSDSTLLVYEINPLPDFLGDHTLVGETERERLQEHLSRWSQMIASLCAWRDRAIFALRFIADGGRIRVFFVARPLNATTELHTLRLSLEGLLHTHRLVRFTADSQALLQDFNELGRLSRPAFVNLAQYYSTELWQPRNLERFITTDSARKIHSEHWTHPPVLYPWRGPGGPFLLPMESLVSQPVKSVLTAYLMPTALTKYERDWLIHIAAAAESLGEQNQVALGQGASARRVDPAATLAGGLLSLTLRRLSTMPYLSLIQCAADDGRTDVVQAISSAMQAVVQELPGDSGQSETTPSPTGAREYPSTSPAAETNQTIYDSFDLPELVAGGPLDRLPLLTDARGAATVFRLPVSIRGGVPGISVRQFPPDFHPGPRSIEPPADVPSLRLGRYEGGGVAHIPVNDLTRHALITGFTGSGKTVTILQLLAQLWRDHRIPFLVLESAKQEYRQLIANSSFAGEQPRLRVHTLGNENCVPLRLNPFELLPGVRVESRIAKLQSCLEAAVPPFGPSSSVISEALHRVYESQGWSLTDVGPSSGRPKRDYPTLRQFVEAMERVVQLRGYRGEILDNVRAGLIGRFRPLLLGGKGLMFDTQCSSPGPEVLFSQPTVLELNDLNLEEKSLAIMFLLTLLREHREKVGVRDGSLQHVTVVEEAHNVLGHATPESGGEMATKANTRQRAVEEFCSLLTEIRAFGEGLVIADQSPQKLARDAIRNTNLQISHQLRDASDRRAMSDAMIMDADQMDYLGKLEPGFAAIFRTGLEKATFVKVDPQVDAPASHAAGRQDVSDDDLREYMSVSQMSVGGSERILALPGCELCKRPCDYRDDVFPLVSTPVARTAAKQWFANIEQACQQQHGAGTHFREAVDTAVRDLEQSKSPITCDSVWCHIIHRWRFGSENVEWSAAALNLEPAHRQAVEQWFESHRVNRRPSRLHAPAEVG